MKRVLAVAVVATALIAGIAAYGTLAQDDKATQKAEKKSESKAQLGVYVDNTGSSVTKKFDITRTEGAVVVALVPDSPAEKAGIAAGDVIISIDGKMIVTAADLTDAVAIRKPGQTVKIVLVRKGEEKSLDITLAERKEMKIRIPGQEFKAYTLRDGKPGVFSVMLGGGGALGIRFEELNKDLGAYFGAPDGKGVLVLEVMDESAAAKAGLKSGDVILSLDGRDVTDGEDLRYALSRMTKDKKESAEMVILRDRQRMTVTVKPDSEQKKLFHMQKMQGMQMHLDGLHEHLQGLEHLDHLFEGEGNFFVDIPHIEIPHIDLPEIDPILIDIPPIDFEGILPLDLDLDLPFDLNFHLEIEDDGSVTFNDRHFESMDAFREYLRSDDFHKEHGVKGAKTIKPGVRKATKADRAIA